MTLRLIFQNLVTYIVWMELLTGGVKCCALDILNEFFSGVMMATSLTQQSDDFNHCLLTGFHPLPQTHLATLHALNTFQMFNVTRWIQLRCHTGEVYPSMEWTMHTNFLPAMVVVRNAKLKIKIILWSSQLFYYCNHRHRSALYHTWEFNTSWKVLCLVSHTFNLSILWNINCRLRLAHLLKAHQNS